MNAIQKYKDRVKQYGRKYVWRMILRNKVLLPLNRCVLTIGIALFKNKDIQNKIIIESHNDFDCNGGPFYDFLIRNGYNKKYRIVWLLKNKCNRELPENVFAYKINSPSLKKAYDICTAKVFFADDVVTKKVKEEQINFYLTHGSFGLKDAHGANMAARENDLLLSPSSNVDSIMAYEWSLPFPCEKLIHLGFPSEDIFYSEEIPNEFDKLRIDTTQKIILWMPTFRATNDFNRHDSDEVLPYGIPLITSLEMYKELDQYLKEKGVLLVIKLHPMQNLNLIEELEETDNIKWLDAKSVKERGMDTFRMMKFSDALLSDYSSVAYSYLHTNNPIGYVLPDMESYKKGVCVDNIDEYLAGPRIIDFKGLKQFISDIAESNDTYKEDRKKLFDFIYEHHDGNSSKRIVEFLKL